MPMNPRLLRPLATGRLLLDFAKGADAAYSLRRISSSYSGPVVRVRRSSDSEEADFTADEVAGSLATWVGAGNDGLVRTWYDQSGNGNDAGQSVAASQPKIVISGALATQGGKPVVNFSASNDFHLSLAAEVSASTLFACWRAVDTNFSTLLAGAGSTAPRITCGNAAVNRSYVAFGFGSPSLFVNGIAYDGTSSVPGLGHHLLTLTTATLSGSIDRLGANTSFSSFGFRPLAISEVIFYSSDKTALRPRIEDNIVSYFGF
jgi:hypothetical protein